MVHYHEKYIGLLVCQESSYWQLILSPSAVLAQPTVIQPPRQAMTGPLTTILGDKLAMNSPKTELKRVDPENLESERSKAVISEAARKIRNGEIVAFPTETVYGLGANALDPSAVRKIFAAKGRPSDNPLIVHISNFDMIRQLAADHQIPQQYLPLVQRFWPGPLTILVPVDSSKVPAEVTAGLATVAVRMPAHPVARALIDAAGVPIAAPSANSSGRPSPTLAQHVVGDLSGKVSLVIDGGPCQSGIESTVIDGLRNPKVILRPGGVTLEDICCVPGWEGVLVFRASKDQTAKPSMPDSNNFNHTSPVSNSVKSDHNTAILPQSRVFVDSQLEDVPTTPGMKYRHYSPSAPVILLAPVSQTTMTSSSLPEIAHLLKDYQQPGVLYHSQNLPLSLTSSINFNLGTTSAEVARNLFRGLRELEAKGCDVIIVEGVPEIQEGLAVMNRARKAASAVIEH